MTLQNMYFILKCSDVDEQLVVVALSADLNDVHHVALESKDSHVVTHDQKNEVH